MLAVTKATTSWSREHGHMSDAKSRRAGAMLTTGTTIPDWTLGVSPWQFDRGRAWLDASGAVRLGVDSLDAEDRDMVCRRYGWGPRPHAIAELARMLDIPVVRATMRLRRAIRNAATHERTRRGTSHP